MTQKLYYEDCHLREFTAVVTGCAQTPKGYEISLSATAFYPEGGGQACDLGSLGGAAVLDVRERGEEIIHLCDGPLTVGAQVRGCLDWARRFDLMQQHSGEHIVSGLVHKLFGYHNVGFHVGKDVMEIDFDGPIPMERLNELERLANEAVFADLPIRCWYPSEEELPRTFYRSKKALPWPVRIVQIPDVDSCACCGVHVGATGQIGLIKFVSCVKFHQGVRIELCCGSRAVKLMQAVFDQNRAVSQIFSAKLLETAEAARKVNEALSAEKLRANALQSSLFDRLASDYAGRGNVLLFREDLSPNQLRELADKISDRCGGWAAVLSGREGAYSICILHKGGDLKPIASALQEHLSARGGGKPGSYQGSIAASEGQIRTVLKDFL